MSIKKDLLIGGLGFELGLVVVAVITSGVFGLAIKESIKLLGMTSSCLGLLVVGAWVGAELLKSVNGK